MPETPERVGIKKSLGNSIEVLSSDYCSGKGYFRILLYNKFLSVVDVNALRCRVINAHAIERVPLT